MAFKVAYSDRRSRALIAIVLAITAMMIRMTTKDTTRIATTIASDIDTKPSWKAFSVSVSVSAREFLNVASIALEMAAAFSGFLISTMNTPVRLARRGMMRFIVSLR